MRIRALPYEAIASTASIIGFVALMGSFVNRWIEFAKAQSVNEVVIGLAIVAAITYGLAGTIQLPKPSNKKFLPPLVSAGMWVIILFVFIAGTPR